MRQLDISSTHTQILFSKEKIAARLGEGIGFMPRDTGAVRLKAGVRLGKIEKKPLSG